MKSVQKLGSLLLAALMILSLAACGSKTNHTPAQTPSNDTPAENTPAETPDDTPVETPDDTPAETPDDAAAEEPDNSTSGGKVLWPTSPLPAARKLWPRPSRTSWARIFLRSPL